jgi:hypothetical protein
MLSGCKFVAISITVGVATMVGCGGSDNSNVTPSSEAGSSGGGEMADVSTQSGFVDSSSSSGSSSGGSSASSGGPMDAGAGMDAGAPGIVCGRTSCNPASQVCCIAARAMTSCTTAMACTGQALTCSGAESCAAGQVCCGAIQAGGGLKTSCAATCPRGDVELCTKNSDCANGTCRASAVGYGTCVAGPPPRDAGRD